VNDEELITRDREVGARLLRRPGDLDRLAGGLLKESADRLEELAAQAAKAKPPSV
jgi:hypothetical protein